jgi:hypothetical protein
MEQLADNGNGSYAYVDDLDEAEGCKNINRTKSHIKKLFSARL